MANLYQVESDDLHGYIDESGELVIPPRFRLAFSFIDGLALVVDAKTRLYGLINQRGDYVIEPQFIEASGPSDGVVAVAIKEPSRTGHLRTKFFYVDGSECPCLTYTRSRPFREGRALVADDRGKWGMIDSAGTVFLPFIHDPDDLGYWCSDGRVGFCADESWGYYDRSGAVAISPRYTDASCFFEGLADVSVDSKTLGYIDTSGRFVIPPTFSSTTSFWDGRASVRIDDRWVHIRRDGSVIDALSRFDESPISFAYGLGTTYVQDRYLVMDTKGTEIMRIDGLTVKVVDQRVIEVRDQYDFLNPSYYTHDGVRIWPRPLSG